MYISVSLSVDWREAGPLKHTRSTSHLATITDLFFGTYVCALVGLMLLCFTLITPTVSFRDIPSLYY